ncbi:MAG: LptA/OstA family protein [Alphaproteobacteria bacterium]|nr:LptA/OstA family protein [Alphaproteobacteria bacterium]
MRRLLFALMLALALTGPAAAQFESDSNAPVEITADAMEWMNEEGIAIARGNADAVQGRYRLRADVLTAYVNQGENTSPNRIRRIDAEGNVTLTTPTESARGQAGTYDVERKVVVLEGSVVLTQGTTVLRGEHLVMDLVSGRSTLQGGASGNIQPADDGRVKMIFEPESGN